MFFAINFYSIAHFLCANLPNGKIYSKLMEIEMNFLMFQRDLKFLQKKIRFIRMNLWIDMNL